MSGAKVVPNRVLLYGLPVMACPGDVRRLLGRFGCEPDRLWPVVKTPSLFRDTRWVVDMKVRRRRLHSAALTPLTPNTKG